MHAAVQLSGVDFVASPAIPARRANRLMVAGAAMVTAGALVAGPAAGSLPDQIQQRTVGPVELTGLSVTASPLTVYPQIVTNTVTNLTALSQAVLADPLPILSQVGRNQLGYLGEIGDAVLGLPARWETYSEGRGATFVANFQAALADGNTAEAVNQLSSYVLYGLQAAITPIYNAFLTYTPRGSTVPNPGIPQQIAQNFANAVGAIFSTTTLVNGIFQPLYGATLSVLATAGDIVGGFAQSVSAGDVEGAVNTLVNTPGLFVNAVLNGWNNPKSAAPFPALLTFIPVAPPTDPANGVTVTGTSIGLLGRLLVSIPKSIAKAITPVTTPAAGSAVTAASTTAVESAEAKAVTSAASQTASAPTDGTTTETSESDSPSAPSAPKGTGGNAAKKAGSASASTGNGASAGASTGGGKKSAGTAKSARGKASTSGSDSK